MHSGTIFLEVNFSMSIDRRTILTLLLFLAWVNAASALHLEIIKDINGSDAYRNNQFSLEDHLAELLCPDADTIKDCTCTVVVGQLFLNCSAIDSEEDLALVFQQDFPVKNFTQFDLNKNSNIRVLGPIFNGITFENINLDFNENLEMITDEFLLDSLNTLQILQIKFSKLHRATFPFSMLPFFNKLQTLKIDNSVPLTSIPTLTSDSLREVSFHGSSIDELESGTFDGAPQLSEIFLDNNKLTSLGPGSFRLTDNLLNINLYQNNIANIDPGAFVIDERNGNPDYLVIDMAPNFLTELRTGTFPLLDCPVSLILYDNNINTIRPGAFVLPSTTENFSLALSLENNQLTTLEEEVFGDVFPYLKSFFVYNNPLACGCDIAWIVLNRDYMGKVDGLATCADGVNLHDLNPDDFAIFC